MILKFQQGGLAPLVSYEPVTVAGPASTSATSSSGSTSQDLTSKDLYKMIDKLDGLPSDMGLIFQKLRNFEWNQDNNPFNTTDIETQYLSILNDLKVANFNKKEYDNAFEIIKANGGINELAISDRGMLYCMNQENNDLKLLSIDKLKDNPNYVALTNGELLNLRSQNPELANQNNILRVVQNGIGIETVTKYISDTISSLGSDKQVRSGFGAAPKGAVIAGLQDFLQQAQQAPQGFNGTIQDLYKYKQLTESQARQAKMAIEYLYRTMPQNMKTLLKTKTQGGTDKEAVEYIQQLITSKISNTSEFDIDFETSHKSTSKDGKKSAGGFDMDPISLMQAGYGQKQTITIQTAEGGNNGIELDTVRMPIVNKEGKSIGTSATLSDVTTSGFSGYLDFENASMGGTMIPTVGFNNIAINGTALYTGYLPIDIKEYNETGNIKPDIGMLGRFKEAQKRIAQENIIDPQQINAIYQEYHLPVMFNSQGVVLTNYKKFGMINATALETAFNTDVTFDNYLYETTDENVIANTLTILNKSRGEKDRIDHDEKSFLDSIFGTDYDRVYKGTIFIPVNEDHFTATAGFGNYPTTMEAETIEAKQQAKERSLAANNSYINPGRL